LTEGLDLMRQRERAALFVSVEAGREPPAESIVRAVARRVRSDLARRQRRAGMRRQYALSVFEARGRDGLPKFGAHIVALMPTAPARDKLIESLNGAAYDGHVLAKPVYDWSGLAGYLLKEATSQAWWGARKSFRRVGGSIPLGVRGGDRVRLSEDLRDALMRSGRIEPYRRTYAKRLPGAPAFLAELEAVYRDGLFDELPLLAVPVRPKPSPVKRLKIEPPSLPLILPPSIADLLAGLGSTHQEIAERVGLSRPQTTNIIVGRFGVSRPVAQRVLELSAQAA